MPSRRSPEVARNAAPSAPIPLTNAEIATTLLSLAQLLAATGENPFKIKAYRRAAESINGLAESVEDLVRADRDLTHISGIGKGISGAIREIVQNRKLESLENLRAEVPPELAALTEHPRLDPKLVLRIFRKLGISTVSELQARLERGEILRSFGVRTDRHIRQALSPTHEMLLVDADDLAAAVHSFLLTHCASARVEVVGDVRRRVEVIGSLSFLIECDDFSSVVNRFQKFGGRSKLIDTDESQATFTLSSGVTVQLENSTHDGWGVALIAATGSPAHVELLAAHSAQWEHLATSARSLSTETLVYRKLGLQFVPPELREGHDEVARAARRAVPKLVAVSDICGELHAHSTSSDGANSIEQMALAARERGYAYLGISDHSQSLKIAGGVSEKDLWQQIRVIDALNEKLTGIQILKSAEVDILADGTLDYPDNLLAELDYTVCSIHSKFSLPREQQTARILRAMDNPYFTLLGHATGRMLLRRPGYQIDVARIVEHARAVGCYLEINASPDRLDLSADHARLAREAGVKIAICTDAHSVSEFGFIRHGVDQARRAGLEKKDILNARRWSELKQLFHRRRSSTSK